ERIPNWALYLIALVAPLVIMPIINLVSIRSWWDWHNSWLGLILSLGLTGTITNIVKITAGRPRPDLVSRCQPVFNSANAPIFGLTDASICTQSDMKVLKDGFRSYSPRIQRESDEDGEGPNATPVPASLAVVGDFTNNGSQGPDDTVQRNHPDVSE
ncbi:hypothetical protein FRC00_009332, partial [Tulasnella sp. 408]